MAALRVLSCVSHASVLSSAAQGVRRAHTAVARPAAVTRVSNCMATCMPSFAQRPSAHLLSASPRQFASIACNAGATEGDLVSVNYTGTLDDGTVFDTSLQEGREPLEFEVGAGTVVAGFDKCVMGLEVGETRTLRIDAADAYGEWKEENTATFSAQNAPEGVEEGDVVQLSNGMRAVVTKLTEEEITIDANHPLAGKALTFEVELMTLTKDDEMEFALFGGGCFWGVELNFQRQFGVVGTKVGYAQGDLEDPSYEQVCSGTTNHNEVVKVKYDPKETTFEALCSAFLNFHDPTTLNRQGGDTGTQYRSGIYFTTEEQKATAEKVIAEQQAKFDDKIVTEVEPAATFFTAEEYHQQYLARGGRNGNAQDPSKGCTDPVRCYG